MYRCKVCGRKFDKPGWVPSVPPRKEQPACPFCKSTLVEETE